MKTKFNDNPFIVAGSIPPEYFCDRVDESRRLIRDVTNGNNLLLISPRRMGKTGLITHCFANRAIADRFDTYYIDILQTTSLKEFTFLLGREVFARVAPRGELRLKKLIAVLRSISGSFGFDPISGLPTFNLQIGDIAAPEVTLAEIFSYLSKSETPSILAIDEFQQIATYKDEKNAEAVLRSYIQHLPSTRFIYAGSERHMLQRMFTDSARPFYNSASVLELKAIEQDVYSEFVTRLFREREKSVASEAVDLVYKAFEGNTFYIQKTFNLAFSMTGRGGECSTEIIVSTIAEMLASYDTIFREMLATVSESQKNILLAIAQEGVAEGVTSSKFVRKYALSSASSVQSAVKKLLERGLITNSEKKYQVQDPLMRIWLLLTYGVKSLKMLISDL